MGVSNLNLVHRGRGVPELSTNVNMGKETLMLLTFNNKFNWEKYYNLNFDIAIFKSRSELLCPVILKAVSF